MYSTITLTLSLLAASICNALPASIPQALEQRAAETGTWNLGATTLYPIHSSCNATERAQLERAFNETFILAQHAKDHILRFGHESTFYTRYFGNASTAEPAGWFDRIINADKTGALFRCDDIDGNCHQEGWAGHWRGANATDQTVICPLSFESRWPLEAMCGHGYTVSKSKDSNYFAADLLHRLYHTSKIAEGIVDHYADTYDDILALAKNAPQQAVRNSATLRRFAVDVYAYDIALPGEGCSGIVADVNDSHAVATTNASTTAAAAAATSAAVKASTTVAGAVTTTAAAATECHTHSDGVVHCA